MDERKRRELIQAHEMIRAGHAHKGAKLPWYAVPGYKKCNLHRVLNSDGELVGKFQTLEDATLTAEAVNRMEVNDD